MCSSTEHCWFVRLRFPADPMRMICITTCCYYSLAECGARHLRVASRQAAALVDHLLDTGGHSHAPRLLLKLVVQFARECLVVCLPRLLDVVAEGIELLGQVALGVPPLHNLVAQGAADLAHGALQLLP